MNEGKITLEHIISWQSDSFNADYDDIPQGDLEPYLEISLSNLSYWPTNTKVYFSNALYSLKE